jgi:hypothetical protein
MPDAVTAPVISSRLTLDPIGKLPSASSRAKLLDLRDRAADLGAALAQVIEGQNEARARLYSAEAELRRLLGDGGRFSGPAVAGKGGNGEFAKHVDETHPAVLEARARIAHARSELERLGERAAVIGEQASAARALLQHAEAYLRAAPAGSLAEHEPITLDDEESDVAALRIRIAETVADLRAVAAAPFPASHLRPLIRQGIEDLASRGTPDLFAAVEVGDGRVRWRTLNQRDQIYGHVDVAVGDQRISAPMVGFASDQGIDPLGLICWLLKDKVLEALDAELLQAADDGRALTPQQRAKREADLRARLLDLERREVIAANLAAIDLRPDCDVRAFLGIDGPAPRSAA